MTEEKQAIVDKLEESDVLRARLEETVEESKHLVEDMRRELNQATVRITELEKEPEKADKDSDTVAQLKDELQATQAKLEDAQTLATESTPQGDDISALQETTKAQEELLESLTSQLEEREQRANRLQRQVRELGTQIKEHESDIVAWEMELKFRNTRISQLETENEKLQKDIAVKPQKNGPPPPPVPQSIQEAVNSVGPPPRDNPDALRTKVGQLNEALGDKDAELLILHGQIEDSKRRMEYTRNILEEIVKQNKVDSQTAQQFSDLVQAMK
jgi:chromosome segregation ATPase